MVKLAKAVVVTGASTGIGWGVCKVLSAKGFRVFGSVRRQGDAERLRQELGEAFSPLVFDVTDPAAVAHGAGIVSSLLAGERLFALINNAGVAVAGPILEISPDEFRRQIDINLTGVLITTQAFAPHLGVDSDLRGAPGRILNISSVGAKTAFPFMAPYHASKFGLEGFSESLRRELMPFGIDVIVVAPGGVRTAIWDKAEAIDLGRYRTEQYAEPLRRMRAFMVQNGRRGMRPEAMGKRIYSILTEPRPKTRYTISPDPWSAFVTRRMPKRVLDRLLATRLGLLPQSGPP